MAYRIKGILTKKQREDLASFIRGYNDITTNESSGEAIRQLFKSVFYPWFMLAWVILLFDEAKIFERIVSGK